MQFVESRAKTQLISASWAVIQATQIVSGKKLEWNGYGISYTITIYRITHIIWTILQGPLKADKNNHFILNSMQSECLRIDTECHNSKKSFFSLFKL